MDLETVETVLNENEAIELTAAVMGVQPLRALRAPLTRPNLEVLRWLGLPVPTVLSAGSTGSGGSYILLSWLPGQDLVYELAAMNRSQMSRLAEQWVDLQQRVSQLPE